jgi:serine/threonine protein kinase
MCVCVVQPDMQGVCSGVACMHRLNTPLAHRDIKAANVMLAPNDVPVIIDLGSATPVRDHGCIAQLNHRHE